MKREIKLLNEKLDNQEIQRGSDTDEDEENEDERLGEMTYEDRVLSDIEGRSEAIKIDVSDYASSLKPKELIDWLNEMGIFLMEAHYRRKEDEVCVHKANRTWHASIGITSNHNSSL